MKKYYHGTSYYCAYRILKEGFRSLRYFGCSGVKGDGIYVSDDLSYCEFMSRMGVGSPDGKLDPNKSCMIECELKLDKPIFWVTGEYDEKVIKYLKKEFSKDIAKISQKTLKCIPSNKHLTRKELINLVNYWDQQRNKRWKKDEDFWYYVEICRKLLSKSGYAAWGEYTHREWDSDEIVVFNPSQVIPKKVYKVVTNKFNDDTWMYEDVKIGEEVPEEELQAGYDSHRRQIQVDIKENWIDTEQQLYK